MTIDSEDHDQSEQRDVARAVDDGLGRLWHGATVTFWQSGLGQTSWQKEVYLRRGYWALALDGMLFGPYLSRLFAVNGLHARTTPKSPR